MNIVPSRSMGLKLRADSGGANHPPSARQRPCLASGVQPRALAGHCPPETGDNGPRDNRPGTTVTVTSGALRPARLHGPGSHGAGSRSAAPRTDSAWATGVPSAFLRCPEPWCSDGPDHKWDSSFRQKRSRARSVGREIEHFRFASCCRRARFSAARGARPAQKPRIKTTRAVRMFIRLIVSRAQVAG
jgi:hypothetical protein